MDVVFFEQLFQYYATDWVATISTFVYLWLIGNKKRSGFFFAVIASISWLIFGWLNNSYASIFANFVFIILNIRGYIKWSKNNP